MHTNSPELIFFQSLQKLISNTEIELNEIAKKQDDIAKEEKRLIACLEHAKQLLSNLINPFPTDKKHGLDSLTKNDVIQKNETDKKNKTVLEIVRSHGRVNVSVNIIANEMKRPRGTMRAWINRQINNGKISLKFGLDQSHYSII